GASGFNDPGRPSKYGAYHHIVNASRESQEKEEYVVAGNLCESGDVFTRDAEGSVLTRRLDHTEVADLIAFCDASADGFSMASHYNARLLPPEVMVDGDSM